MCLNEREKASASASQSKDKGFYDKKQKEMSECFIKRVFMKRLMCTVSSCDCCQEAPNIDDTVVHMSNHINKKILYVVIFESVSS